MKIAVVTGASSGMGREFVLQLAERKEAEEIWAIAPQCRTSGGIEAGS